MTSTRSSIAFAEASSRGCANAGWRVYDQYLKANRVEEGIRSYGSCASTLILRARLDDGWVPVRTRPLPQPRTIVGAVL